jgi:hypothetical protein
LVWLRHLQQAYMLPEVLQEVNTGIELTSIWLDRPFTCDAN